MRIEPSDVEACRERGGDSDHAGEYVAEALEEPELLGHRNEAPLADRSYTDYPEDYYSDPEDVRPFLERLANHSLITSVGALAEELGLDENTANDIAALYDLDLPRNGFDVAASAKPDDALVLPDGETWPINHLANDPAADHRVLAQLLAVDGMSIEEVATYLTRELRRVRGGARGRWNVEPREVRANGEAAGLLPSDEDEGTSGTQRAETSIHTGRGVVIDSSDI